jgi:hypothetical protein
MNVPTEAITAAAKAIHCASCEWDLADCMADGVHDRAAREALEAAAPLIAARAAAAERELCGDASMRTAAAAVYGERDRIRRHAQEHAFRLYRPGMGFGPEHGESLDVVPLTSLLEVL